MVNGVLMKLNPNSWDQDFTFTLSAAVANSIVSSRTYVAGYIPLNGTLATVTVAQLPVVATITLTSSTNLASISFVITGINLSGTTVTETLLGPNNNTVTSIQSYWRVISIVPSASNAGTVSAGITGDVDAISIAAVPSSGISLNVTSGILASATKINLVNPAYLTETAVGNESSNTLTVHGYDVNGRLLTKTLAEPNATLATLSTSFAKILWISQANTNAGNITIGNGNAGYGPWIVWDRSRPFWQAEIGVQLTGTATYSIQHCLGLSLTNDNELLQNDVVLASSTTSGSTYLSNENFQASRVLVSSNTSGTFRMITSQANNGHASTKANFFNMGS